MKLKLWVSLVAMSRHNQLSKQVPAKPGHVSLEHSAQRFDLVYCSVQIDLRLELPDLEAARNLRSLHRSCEFREVEDGVCVTVAQQLALEDQKVELLLGKVVSPVDFALLFKYKSSLLLIKQGTWLRHAKQVLDALDGVLAKLTNTSSFELRVNVTDGALPDSYLLFNRRFGIGPY